MESVDYTDTFITVAPDSTATAGAVPQPRAGKATVASATYEAIALAPYRRRSSDVIFIVWADRQALAQDDREAAWAEFYACSRACLRASDLGKKFGWGIHADGDGRLALYAVGSPAFEALASGTTPDGIAVTVTPAVRSRRA